jgi:DNA repair protein RecO (recombination protein O)
MGLGRSAAVVIGSFPLGESDRVVTFYSREFGKLRGVARASRRIRSRFAGALELFTLGELIFFDGGRSELVQVDHFDIVRPFVRLRENLERLGHASWVVECVARLTADHDRHAALYGLLVRSLKALEGPAPPARVAVCFGVRGLDALGHRPRLDACTVCARAYPFRHAAFGAEGVVCESCARGEAGVVAVSAASLAAIERLRSARWEDALEAPLGRSEAELGALLDVQMSRLIGQPTRTAKFLRELRRLEPPFEVSR